MKSIGKARYKRVFIVGAGMSKDSGFPLTKEFLHETYARYTKKEYIKLVENFRVALNEIEDYPSIKNPSDLETIWSVLDRSILQGKEIPRHDVGKLLEVRNALLTILTDEFTAVHDCLDSVFAMFFPCWDVALSLDGYTTDQLDDVVRFLDKPRHEIELLIKKIRPAKLRRIYSLLLDASGHGRKILAKRILDDMYRQRCWSYGSSKNFAANISRFIIADPQVRKKESAQYLSKRQDLFWQKMDNSISRKHGADYLGLEGSEKDDDFTKILWKIFLMRNYEKQMQLLQRWMYTYYALINNLRPGDAIITTNYDYNLELAIKIWKDRSEKYGVLFGTEIYDLHGDGSHVERVPGTVEEYAMREYTGEGHLQYAFKELQAAQAKLKENKDGEDKRIISYEIKLCEKRWMEAWKRWKALNDSKAWIPILKLHGSLDWGICETCSAVHSVRSKPFWKAKRTILAKRRYDKVYKKAFLCCHHPKLSPFMVPPTSMKDYDNRALVSIWSEAGRRLCNADSLIFIGYSFPKADKRVRQLFNKARFNRKGKKWQSIVLVDKRAKQILSRYTKLFGDIVKPITMTASEYFAKHHSHNQRYRIKKVSEKSTTKTRHIKPGRAGQTRP